MSGRYWTFSYTAHVSEAPKRNFDWGSIREVSYAIVRVDENQLLPDHVVVLGYVETKKPCEDSIFFDMLPEADFNEIYSPNEERDDILKKTIRKNTLGPWEYGNWRDVEEEHDLDHLERLLKAGFKERQIHSTNFRLWAKYRDVIRASIEIRAQPNSVSSYRKRATAENEAQ